MFHSEPSLVAVFHEDFAVTILPGNGCGPGPIRDVCQDLEARGCQDTQVHLTGLRLYAQMQAQRATEG